MSRPQSLVLAVMLLRQVQPEKTSVLKFALSVILSTQESRSLLIQADVLTDSKDVSILRNNYFYTGGTNVSPCFHLSG